MQRDRDGEITPGPGQVTVESAEELAIEPGARMLVEPQDKAGRFWTEFVGMIRDKYLIVRLPPNFAALKPFLERDTFITVRYLDGPKVCGFTTAASGMSFRIAPLLFLRYPDSIEVLNLRRHERVNCLIPGSVFHGDTELRGIIVNISLSGCRVVALPEAGDEEPDLAKEHVVSCRFKMFDSDAEHQVKGHIKNTLYEGQKYFYGVEFDEIGEEAAKSISAYVASAREYLGE